MGFSDLSPEQLARLIPELLLGGHLIDRAAMPHVIAALGREGMEQVAIQEWRGASPHYTARMRRALGLTGHTVTDMFKCLQIDVGAPPQFMDFRFSVYDANSGGFELAHCGALLDVEPMGAEYVHGMCHTIEDPTFDATAVATHPQARIRPIHRPPRVPSDRRPHCAWSVTIDEHAEPLDLPWEAQALADSHAVTWEDVASTSDGYRGPLQTDVDWAGFSPDLLLRLAQEISLQWHLLGIALHRALERACSEETSQEIVRRSSAGIGGWMGRRLRGAFPELTAAQVWALHPMLNPTTYVGASWDEGRVTLSADAPAVSDGSWRSLTPEGQDDILSAIGWGIDGVGEPSADVRLVGFSGGAEWSWQRRASLPIWPI